MNRALVFIGGAYDAPTPDMVSTNVGRAIRLGTFASSLGFVPFVPHAQGVAGVYGFPGAYPEGHAVRARAMLVSCTFARLIGAELGQFWGISRLDESLSPGTQQDLDAFRNGGGRLILIRPWTRWLMEITNPYPAPPAEDPR